MRGSESDVEKEVDAHKPPSTGKRSCHRKIWKFQRCSLILYSSSPFSISSYHSRSDDFLKTVCFHSFNFSIVLMLRVQAASFMYTLWLFKRNEKKHEKFILISSFKRVHYVCNTSFIHVTPHYENIEQQWEKYRKVNNSISLVCFLLFIFIWILVLNFMLAFVTTRFCGVARVNFMLRTHPIKHSQANCMTYVWAIRLLLRFLTKTMTDVRWTKLNKKKKMIPNETIAVISYWTLELSFYFNKSQCEEWEKTNWTENNLSEQ